MKTVIIYDQLCAGLEFIVLDGDYTHLNNVYINGDSSNEDMEELSNLLYGEEGVQLYTALDGFPVEEVKNGAKVIVAGFLP